MHRKKIKQKRSRDATPPISALIFSRQQVAHNASTCTMTNIKSQTGKATNPYVHPSCSKAWITIFCFVFANMTLPRALDVTTQKAKRKFGAESTDCTSRLEEYTSPAWAITLHAIIDSFCPLTSTIFRCILEYESIGIVCGKSLIEIEMPRFISDYMLYCKVNRIRQQSVHCSRNRSV